MKWLIISVYLVSITWVHLRGRLRLPLRTQLAGGATLLAPVNLFMYLFSKTPTTPFVRPDELPGLAPLREHWQTILAEAERLKRLGEDGMLSDCWEDVYLKWYDTAHPSAREVCPRTCALLRAIPSIKLASFVEMPPRMSLQPHRDPYAGWLRYHLGLATPNDDACFMEVDGRRHTWRDGQAMVFDETYVHWADNACGRSRLVLLCDVERPMRFRWAQAVNHWFGRTLATVFNPSAASGGGHEPDGMLHRSLRAVGRCRRQLRAHSLAAYRLALAASVAGVAAMLYLL